MAPTARWDGTDGAIGAVSKALVDQGFKNSVVAYSATVGIDVQVGTQLGR